MSQFHYNVLMGQATNANTHLGEMMHGLMSLQSKLFFIYK